MIERFGELDAELKHCDALAAINLAAVNFANQFGQNPPPNVATVLDLTLTAYMFRHAGKYEQAAYPEVDQYKSGISRKVFHNHGTNSTMWISDN